MGYKMKDAAAGRFILRSKRKAVVSAAFLILCVISLESSRMDGQACLHRHADIRRARTASGIYAVGCTHRAIG